MQSTSPVAKIGWISQNCERCHGNTNHSFSSYMTTMFLYAPCKDWSKLFVLQIALYQFWHQFTFEVNRLRCISNLPSFRIYAFNPSIQCSLIWIRKPLMSSSNRTAWLTETPSAVCFFVSKKLMYQQNPALDWVKSAGLNLMLSETMIISPLPIPLCPPSPCTPGSGGCMAFTVTPVPVTESRVSDHGHLI